MRKERMFIGGLERIAQALCILVQVANAVGLLFGAVMLVAGMMLSIVPAGMLLQYTFMPAPAVMATDAQWLPMVIVLAIGALVAVGGFCVMAIRAQSMGLHLPRFGRHAT